MGKRLGGITRIVKSFGLYIPKETKTTTLVLTAEASNGRNESSPEAQQSQTQPTTAPIEPTFHGPGNRMTDGLSIHRIFDMMRAIENERRGQYTAVDAFLRTFSGKCYDCMKGSALGPGEPNPTNSLFPIIDLLYEMLWDLRVKLLDWTDCPWADKIVLEGIEDPAVKNPAIKRRLQTVMGGSVGAGGANGTDVTMSGT